MPANGVTGPGLPCPDLAREPPMARNHYGFEKRQRELIKERKKEEKRQRKLERRNADQDFDSEAQEPGDSAEPDSSG
jgi:primosomal protein N''